MGVIGYIHSFESLGAVDGPGLRFIVFMQGCPLRCLYCHNPDSWNKENAGYKMTADKVYEKIAEYKHFIKNGGVTISGGEPLLQARFCEELIELLKKDKIETAIDTSGIISLEKSKRAIELCDLIILDIKDIDDEGAKKLTGAGIKNAQRTLEYTKEIKKRVWIRQVILEGYTLNEKKLARLGGYLCSFENIERIELIPYHTMGVSKWDELGLDYSLRGVKTPQSEEMDRAREILKRFEEIKEKVK